MWIQDAICRGGMRGCHGGFPESAKKGAIPAQVPLPVGGRTKMGRSAKGCSRAARVLVGEKRDLGLYDSLNCHEQGRFPVEPGRPGGRMLRCGYCGEEVSRPALCRWNFLCIRCYIRALKRGRCDRCENIGELHPTRNGFKLLCWGCMMAEADRVFRQIMDRAAGRRHG